MNVKVFNLMPRVKQTWFLAQDESCECKCRLNESYVIQQKNGLMMNVDVSVRN